MNACDIRESQCQLIADRLMELGPTSTRSVSRGRKLCGWPTPTLRDVKGDFRIVYCRDPKGGPPIFRRASAELAAFPLAPRTPGRVARLKAIGNSIVPQLAAVVLRAWMATNKEKS